MAEEMTPSAASNLLEAVRVLEELERRGELTRSEEVALQRFRNKQKSAEQEMVETRARYRGVAQGLSLRSRDELAGALSAITGGSYSSGRDQSRQLDEAARLLAPDEFARGELAGSGMIAALPIGGTQALAARAGLGVGGRMALSAGTGAALAAAPDFLGGEGGLMSRASEVSPFWTGVGGALGALGPVAGEVGAAGIRVLERARRAVPNFGSKATNVMAGAFDRTQSTGEDIAAYLQGLGGQGMLADVPGPLRSTAQGLAAQGGSGSTVLSRNINERAAGAGERIEGAVDRVAGAPNRAFEQEKARAAERSSVYGPLYDTAKQSQDPIDVRAITSMLTFARSNATGKTRTMYDNLLNDLASKDGTVSAEKLHNIRVDLGDAVNEAARAGAGGFVGNMKPVLDEIDARLDTIAGYATARGGWADTKALDNAAEEGRSVLTGGPTTVETPQRFAERFSGLTDAQKEAMRSGVREYIASLMGTSRNDAAAAWAQLSDKGFNDAKLRILFGDNEAGFILSTLRGEKAFSETKSKVLEGAQTSFREAARRDLGDVADPETLQRPGPVSRVKQAVFDNPVNAVIDAVIYGTRRSRANEEIGRLLTLQGAERDAAVRALLREAERMNQNTRAQSTIRGLAELLARGGANAYVQDQQQGPR